MRDETHRHETKVYSILGPRYFYDDYCPKVFCCRFGMASSVGQLSSSTSCRFGSGLSNPIKAKVSDK